MRMSRAAGRCGPLFSRFARHALSAPPLLQFAPLLLFAYALRLAGTAGHDLWVDEAISYWIASKGPGDIVVYSLTHIFEHPPGFYLLLHFWMKLAGDSEFAMRALSALGGTLSVAVLVTLARRWFDRATAWVAGLLMALWPLAAQQARDARMYTWLAAIALLAVYAFDRAVERNRKRDWVLLAALLALSAGLHYLAALAALGYLLAAPALWRSLAGRRVRMGAVFGVFLGLPLVVFAVAPGPRSGVMSFAEAAVHDQLSLARFVPAYAGYAIGGSAEGAPPAAAVPATAAWGLFAFGVVSLRSHRRAGQELRWLLALLVIAPIVAGVMLFPYIAPRHVSALLGLYVLGVALGIVGLARCRSWLGVAAVLIVAGAGLYYGFPRPVTDGREFSAPMSYIDDRARPDEPVVLTYFFDWPLKAYYDRVALHEYQIPGENGGDLSLEQLIPEAQSAISENNSLWLLIRPSEMHPERTERAFDAVAYPTEKVWFDGGRGVVRYFGPAFMQSDAEELSWQTGVRLVRRSASSAELGAGDAIRLELTWQSTRPQIETALHTLDLYGEDGQVWARQVNAPCNGNCPVTGWGSDSVTERAAFYIPPDVPPGHYTLRLGWVTPDGQPVLLEPQPGGGPGDQDAKLLDVTVTAARPGGHAAPLGPVLDCAAGPGLTLRSVAFDNPHVQPGARLVVPLQWSTDAAGQALELRLTLTGPGGQATLSQPLGAAWYPSERWPAGGVLRTQPEFALPGSLKPGAYQANITVSRPGGADLAPAIPIGLLTITDRPHRFTMPAGGVAVEAGWENNIRLAKVTMPAQGRAGEQVPLTLIWQATGPVSRNWKVFVHLVDPGGAAVAQGDAYPVNGEDGPAPTMTWQNGEIIEDPHTIALPGNLHAGSYTVEVGWYDESTEERPRLHEGGDTLRLPARLLVEAP